MEGASSANSSEPGASPGRGPEQTNLSAAVELCAAGQDGVESQKTKSLADTILALREEQLRVRADRKRVQKELKNAQRRKRRLKTKARALSNTDLLQVLLMRQAEKADPESQEAEGTGEEEAKGDKEAAAEKADSEA